MRHTAVRNICAIGLRDTHFIRLKFNPQQCNPLLYLLYANQKMEAAQTGIWILLLAMPEFDEPH